MPSEFDLISSALEGFTYKPGWTIEAISSDYPDSQWSTKVQISFMAPNAHFWSPWDDEEIPQREVIGVYQFAHVLLIEDGVLNLPLLKIMLSSWIKELEIHESDEWLKHDGVALKNPHRRSP